MSKQLTLQNKDFFTRGVAVEVDAGARLPMNKGNPVRVPLQLTDTEPGDTAAPPDPA